MQPPFVLLDFPATPAAPGTPGGAAGPALLFERPREVLCARRLEEVAPVLHAVDTHVAAGRHAVGFVAYEAAPAFDPALVTRAAGAAPFAWFGIFDTPRTITPP